MQNNHNQIPIKFEENDDVKELIETVEQNEGEDRETFIERIATTIEQVGELVENEGYSIKAAIEKKIYENSIVFKSPQDRVLFINNISSLDNE